MNPIENALSRLEASGAGDETTAGPLAAGLARTGVAFAAVGGRLEERWNRALVELDGCIAPLTDGGPAVLWEGGPYPGAWLESTATINAELLDRFAPDVTRDTHLLLAAHRRDDGLLPYKVTADGPGFSQIQMVTPLARCVWNHYLLTGRDRDYLRTMYDAMSAHDAWLAAHRDTRGTGAVEAFGTFDTGHDGSPRFWHLPDRPLGGDAAVYDPLVPNLPLIAPDLTANVACQRGYLARIAAELGEDRRPWDAAASASLASLAAQCYDADDGTWYDRTPDGRHLRLESDVLLRVLACEVGDGALFVRSLERYLMHTRKLLSAYGFTSLALDDPRFEHDAARNSWGGPVNFLSQVRAPHAFEHHGHVAELALVAGPVLTALAAADAFPQCLDPWSGRAAYTERYSPAILWFLDAVERSFGVLPRPDGELWFSGLTPTRLAEPARAAAVAYRREVGGVRFELAGDDAVVQVWREGEPLVSFPRGLRVRTDGTGRVRDVVGLAAGTVRGTVRTPDGTWEIELAPNQVVELGPDGPRPVASPGFVPPQH